MLNPYGLVHFIFKINFDKNFLTKKIFNSAEVAPFFNREAPHSQQSPEYKLDTLWLSLLVDESLKSIYVI